MHITKSDFIIVILQFRLEAHVVQVSWKESALGQH